MRRKVVLVVCFCLATVILCGGCNTGPTDPFSSKAMVPSPNGSIQNGASAVSPNGQYILAEVPPYDGGIVAVSDKDGKEVQRWNILKGSTNDIKGLAWSGDSKQFAVMYHGGDKPGIRVFEVGNDAEIGTIAISEWYHYMAFGDNPDEIIVSVQGQFREIMKIKPSVGIEPSIAPPNETSEPPSAPPDQGVQEGTVSWFFGREDIATSPDGDVPHGSPPFDGRAISRNGKYYACEVKPYDQGNIAVFSSKGKLIQKWEGMSNDNPLKGLAWSPDSKRLAIMYHGGMRPAIQIVRIGKKGVIAASEISAWYHFMAFAEDGKTLLLAESEGGPITKLKPQAIR